MRFSHFGRTKEIGTAASKGRLPVRLRARRTSIALRRDVAASPPQKDKLSRRRGAYRRKRAYPSVTKSSGSASIWLVRAAACRKALRSLLPGAGSKPRQAAAVTPRPFASLRVSTTGQTTDNQLQEIKAAGFKVEPRRVVTETVSGNVATSQRRRFTRLLDRLKPGDVRSWRARPCAPERRAPASGGRCPRRRRG